MRSIKNGAESYLDSFFLKDIESAKKKSLSKLRVLYFNAWILSIFKFNRKFYLESFSKDTFL